MFKNVGKRYQENAKMSENILQLKCPVYSHNWNLSDLLNRKCWFRRVYRISEFLVIFDSISGIFGRGSIFRLLFQNTCYMYLALILAARSLIESLRQKSVRLIDDQVVRISRHDLRMNKTGRVSFKACD